ncbi:MAG: transglycosylase domain-containing protein [Clostridiales Family XIII bacterium]|nr:transglycosylase domain-containing protein [Clostridiales Family XIII bacterium]
MDNKEPTNTDDFSKKFDALEEEFRTMHGTLREEPDPWSDLLSELTDTGADDTAANLADGPQKETAPDTDGPADSPAADPDGSALDDFYTVTAANLADDPEADPAKEAMMPTAATAEAAPEESKPPSDDRMAMRRDRRSKNGRSGGKTDAGSRKEAAVRSKSRRSKKGRKKQPIGARIAKWFLSVVLILILVVFTAGFLYLYGIIKDLPDHDPTQIQKDLKRMSTIYDDEGLPIRDIYLDEGQRTLVTYDQIPQNLVNAFIAVEDKTFWTHKGFNIVRILGAIKESVTSGEGVTGASGVSTITQQLARNIWLTDIRSVRTLDRKVKEAYYARDLEENLSKEEILTAYLNTISLGNHSYGIASAAKSYFDKDIEDIDLIESAALAALPQEPSKYSMITTLTPGEVSADDPRILLTTSQYIFLYNDAAEPRIKLVLNLMLEQGFITQAEYNAASAENIRDHLHPHELEGDSNTAYFTDYLITDLAEDLLETMPDLLDMDEAIQMVYSGGLEIHSTLSTRIQNIVSEEVENPANFPGVRPTKDRSGNILDENYHVLLFSYDSLFQTREDGPWFGLTDEEFDILEDGSMVVYAGHRLGIYKTTSAAGNEIALEFKDFYSQQPDGVFYMTKGGIISIPSEYKSIAMTVNDAGETVETDHLLLSAEFLQSEDNIFTVDENGTYWIPPTKFNLRQAIIQPQTAAVILEHHTGYIKAMTGGRGVTGQMNYNRTLSPRQPGSTMKPLGTYGPAIEMSANKEPVGSEIPTFGTYWSPISIIIDEAMTYNGKVWPENWYRSYRSAQTLRSSIEQSINVNAVKVQLAVGDQRSVTFLKKLGITTVVEEGDRNDLNPAALALGGMTRGLTPLQSSSAYGTFANAGVHIDPISYTLVTDRRGNVILEGKPKSTQAMDPGTAFIVNDMLRTTVANGIANRAQLPGVPVAGKTGTSSENYDAWFVGNTPKYSAAFWIGCDVQIDMSAGSAAASAMYKTVMSRVVEGDDQGSFPEKPENVVVATVSGHTDYFIAGTVPEKIDYGVEEVDICIDSGFRATPWCPNHELRKFSTLNAKSQEELDSNKAPEFYCNLHNLDSAQFPNDPNTPIDVNFGKKEVPNLVGKSLTEAQNDLIAIGLKIGTIKQAYSPTVAANIVLTQDYAAGAFLDAETAVNITISKGPDPATVIPPTPPTPDPGGGGGTPGGGGGSPGGVGGAGALLGFGSFASILGAFLIRRFIL